jgi:hypothetical protein
MAIRMKVDLIDREVRVGFDSMISPKVRSQMLADYARQELRTAQQVNRAVLGRIPPHETFVDGRESVALNTVKPDGQIIFEFELLDELLAWIGEQLIKHSPVQQTPDPRPGHPGLYRASHILIADNRLVDPGQPLPEADEYAFVNTQPYARKIERGLSDQAPDGVYQVIAKMAAARFSNLARIRFSYRDPKIGDIAAWAKTTTLQPRTKRSAAGREAWLVRQPAIVVTSR